MDLFHGVLTGGVGDHGGGDVRRCGLHVGGLVVEDDVGTEGGEDLLLADAAQEKCLVHPDAPLAQGLDGPLVGGGSPGGGLN